VVGFRVSFKSPLSFIDAIGALGDIGRSPAEAAHVPASRVLEWARGAVDLTSWGRTGGASCRPRWIGIHKSDPKRVEVIGVQRKSR